MISPITTSASVSPEPIRGPNFRRNHFHALFEQVPLDQPEAPVAKARVPFSPPGAEVRAAHVERDWHETTRSAAAQGEGRQPDPELSWFTPSAPVSLEPLRAAMARAGLAPDQFQFEQVEAYQPFPTRPDLDFTTRQIVIRGPHGVGMFDRDLALRTPWVTAVELQSYGIA